MDGRGQFQAPDARERVRDDLALDVELPRIGDVIEEAPAAEGIGRVGAAIWRCFLHGRGVRVGDALGHPFDPCEHALAGIAPDTRMIRPSARAIIRPPAAGFSIVSESGSVRT